MLVRYRKRAKRKKQEIVFPKAQDEARVIENPIATVFFSSSVVVRSGLEFTLFCEAFRQFFPLYCTEDVIGSGLCQNIRRR